MSVYVLATLNQNRKKRETKMSIEGLSNSNNATATLFWSKVVCENSIMTSFHQKEKTKNGEVLLT